MLLVYNTCPDKKSAKKISYYLIKNKIAACITIIKIEKSIYQWNGKICEEPEYLLIIKIKDKNYKKLENEIKKVHPYSVPEIIALKVKKGFKPYVTWVNR